MLRLYITRHGQTVWNTEKRMQGWNNSDLTAKGIKDAIALGDRLKNINFKCIYSSPSGRAIKTSELIRGDRDITIIQDDNLREISLGDWEGMTFADVEKIDKEAHDAFWNKPHLYVAKTGESFFDLRERISNTISKIISENKDGEVLIVTHAIVVKTIMTIFKGLDVSKLWEQPFIQGTSLSIAEVDSKGVKVVTEGDTSHIKD